jgi:hypothetical protein
MPTASKTALLRIRPSLPDPKEVSAARGPIMMETALSSLHSLSGKNATIGLEIGFVDGKIALFARASARAAALVESQIYAQFPDAEIEHESPDLFDVKEGETAYSCDMTLTSPEFFPIKRHPQFTDLTTRQQIDTIAGITSALVRYPKPGMRGHVEIVLKPVGSHYRHKILHFLPLLNKGLAKHSESYVNLLSSLHLAKGWKKLVAIPPYILLGGFRAWFPSLRGPDISIVTGEVTESSSHDDDIKSSMRSHEREDAITGAADKVNRLLFRACIRVSVIAPTKYAHEAEAKVEEIASSFRQFTLPESNGFKAERIRPYKKLSHGVQKHPYVLSAEEVATLWHIPNILMKTPNFDWVLSKKLEPPVDLPLADDNTDPDDLTVLGEALFRGQKTKFGIRKDDRRRHIYIIGKTGMGKSTLLENMIYSDIHAGRGVAVIDPHGDLVEAVLRFIPPSRTNDVILFDPADKEFPVAFNMLQCENEDQRSLVVSGLMSVFTKLWPEAFSGRMEYITRNSLYALTEAGNQSMLGIMRMFSDDTFRKKIMENVTNHMVKNFWEDEYTSWSDKYRTEAIAAIQNKVGQLLSTPLIRNIVGQVTSKLDIRHAMDSGKIILMNLSKGKLGEDNSAFIGSMFVTKFQLDAMSRADIPEKDRRDFYLYVDEFQNFATESFATILSEARKYRLNLTMAHQYVGQLLLGDNSTALKDAVFGNVGSMVSFQVGSDDAEPLSEQFEEMVLPKDILSLPKYQAYMRLMIKGIPSKPFSVSTLAPPVFKQDEGRVEIIRKLSRERYSEERKVVEEKISKWLETARSGAKNSKSLEKMKEKEEEEMKKARAKKMSLEDYRKWRDREMAVNDFNALRKKKFLGETLTPEEEQKMADLEKSLEATGGVPPPSKTMIQAKEGKPPKKEKQEESK